MQETPTYSMKYEIRSIGRPTMLQVSPLSLHTRALLLQSNLQWQICHCQLLSRRQLATAANSKLSKPRAFTQPTQPVSSAGQASNQTPERPKRDKDDGEFKPKPLSRPLGYPFPPLPGQNSGVDDRTLRQRRDDFLDYDKHLERRKSLQVPDLFNLLDSLDASFWPLFSTTTSIC